MPTVPGSQGPRVALGVLPNARLDVPDMSAPDVRLPTPQLSTPRYDTPQIRAREIKGFTKDPGAISTTRLANPATGKADAADQLTRAGGALISTSETLSRMALAMQAKVNATVTDDALDQARQKAVHLTFGTKDEASGNVVGGYRQLQGEQAIRRPSGKALDEEVGEEFDDFVKQLSKDKLTNDAQRTAFEQQVRQVAAQLRQGAAVYQAEQFDAYQSAVYATAVKNQTAAFATLDLTDLGGQNKALDGIDQAVATKGINEGQPEGMIAQGQRAARSEAVAGMFDRAMSEKKYDVAAALLNTHGDKIDANTATKMRLALDGKVAVKMGEQLADDAWQGWGAPAYNTAEPDRAWNIMLKTESGHRQVGDDGKLIRSPKGAGGIAQLMPPTAKEMAEELGRPELAKLAFKPTEEGQAANLLLGRAYFNKMLTRYRGDMQKAMAAYNAGPGRVDDALKAAGEDGSDWRTHLPAETRAYIAKGKAGVDQGQGQPEKPSKSELYRRIDARTDDPEVRRAAYTRVDRLYAAAEEDERTRHETAYLGALDIVRNNGGDINAIPSAMRAAVRGDQWDNVQSYALKLRTGDPVKTDMPTYFVASSQAWLKAATMNDVMGLRTKLSDTDFKTVANAWNEMHSPTGSKSPTTVDYGSVDRIVDARLQAAGLDTTPGDKDKFGRERMGAVRAFTHQYVLDYQRATGEKLDDAKLEALINQMFTRDQKWRAGGFMNIGTARSTNVMTAKVTDIPQPTRERLTKDFKQRFGRAPSGGELLERYYADQMYR